MILRPIGILVTTMSIRSIVMVIGFIDIRSIFASFRFSQLYSKQGGKQMTEEIKPLTNDELKLCPFCGCTNPFRAEVWVNGVKSLHFIKCGTCGVKGPECLTQEKARMVWNQRAEKGKERRVQQRRQFHHGPLYVEKRAGNSGRTTRRKFAPELAMKPK